MATTKSAVKGSSKTEVKIGISDSTHEINFECSSSQSEVIAKVNEDLVSLNANKNGNKLVPYEPLDGKPFLINKAKMLNHRWIVAEYSNTDLWGQVLIKYFYNDDKPTDFETVETVMYEKQRKK